jgi:hypothetical protein
MAKLFSAPKFQHDCERCRFLAHVQPESGSCFDLYVCVTSVVARTSSEAPDYHALSGDLAHLYEGNTDSIMGRAFWLWKRLEKARKPRAIA